MKRITAIQIENYRAFYQKYKPIVLPNGENLLVYGENGSGKSSLFKALYSYFSSSKSPAIQFELNDIPKNTVSDAGIAISFSDLDASAKVITGSEQTYSFKPTGSTNTEPFIKDTALIKGFLEYKNLLKVYLNNGYSDLNLFDLFINEILKDHIPVQGGESFGEQWKRLDSIIGKIDGRTKPHIDAVDELPGFENKLTNFLKNNLFPRVNSLLEKYFDFNIKVAATIRKIEFDSSVKANGPITELYLQVQLSGKLLTGHTEYLNEARLSALSVCLFLASVLENPQTNFEYKILFLDDVFIGLDSGNRIPIAKILKDEFKDYQIFITTYDRHWYEMAKRFYENTMPEQWKCIEMYLVKESVSISKPTEPAVIYNFDKPLLIEEETNFSKAVNHLHSKTNPDYPAAANYFRKYAEEILKPEWLNHETRSAEDESSIQGYRLTKLASCVKTFLKKINADTSLLEQLEQFLPSLLHPLSHHDLASPIYKGELNEIQSCLTKLNDFMKVIQSKCKIILTPDRLLKLHFKGSSKNHGYYEIRTTDPLYLVTDEGSKFFSDCECYAIHSHGITNGFVMIYHLINKFKSKAPATTYTSINDAYSKIFDHVHTLPKFAHLQKSGNYIDEFEVGDKGQWSPLNTLSQ